MKDRNMKVALFFVFICFKQNFLMASFINENMFIDLIKEFKIRECILFTTDENNMVQNIKRASSLNTFAIGFYDVDKMKIYIWRNSHLTRKGYYNTMVFFDEKQASMVGTVFDEYNLVCIENC